MMVPDRALFAAAQAGEPLALERLLRDMEQLTIAELAARLAITREAAKSRIHRARALVREYLRPT